MHACIDYRFGFQSLMTGMSNTAMGIFTALNNAYVTQSISTISQLESQGKLCYHLLKDPVVKTELWAHIKEYLVFNKIGETGLPFGWVRERQYWRAPFSTSSKVE